MSNEEQINAQLAKAFERYQSENKRLQRFAISEIDRTRLELIDLLNDYAKKDNTISKARINSLLRDLDEVERILYREALKVIDETVNQSATSTVLAVSAILVGVLSIGGFSDNTTRKIVRESVDYTNGRFANKASTMFLDDRIRRLSGEYTDEFRKVLRTGILQGNSVDQMVGDLRKVYDAETWKLRRVVITEGNTAHRTASAISAKESEVVKAIQIVDHPGHKRHEQHECYRLARQNPYGWGEGIYRPEDTYIYSPHPQCTASFRYILKDEYMGGDM